MQDQKGAAIGRMYMPAREIDWMETAPLGHLFLAQLFTHFQIIAFRQLLYKEIFNPFGIVEPICRAPYAMNLNTNCNRPALGIRWH